MNLKEAIDRYNKIEHPVNRGPRCFRCARPRPSYQHRYCPACFDSILKARENAAKNNEVKK